MHCVSSATAILVALFIPRVGYGQYGWSATGVMMGWLFWCFVVFSLLEILKYFDSKRKLYKINYEHHEYSIS